MKAQLNSPSAEKLYRHEQSVSTAYQRVSSNCHLMARGPVDCIVRTVREDGLTGLWRGNLSTWLGLFGFYPARALHHLTRRQADARSAGQHGACLELHLQLFAEFGSGDRTGVWAKAWFGVYEGA